MTPLHSERRQLILIPLAALVAVLPLIFNGCSCGHDFDFHLLNWMEAARQFGHGNLHPHWAFTPAFNAGEPRFVFYPPVSWYLGALLGLALTHIPGVTEAAGWSATPIVFTWLALTLSGLTLYRLARTFVSSNLALLAATLYLANPYMLFTAYERTAYAELLAAAWIPLLFLAILRHRITIPRIAVPIALLWLTNAPAAVMGSYTLALLATIRLIRTAWNQCRIYDDVPVQNPFAYQFSKAYRTARETKKLPLATTISRQNNLRPEPADPTRTGTIVWAIIPDGLRILAGTALGLALAAFYIIPAAYERRFVQIDMATIAGMRIDQNFLFEHTGTSSEALLHDQVLHTASLIAVLLLAATAIALAVIFIQRKSATEENHQPQGSQFHRDRPNGETSAAIFPAVPLVILTSAIAFLLTPLSLPLWNHAPQALFLQFPWRLLAILAPIFALTFARALTQGLGAPFIASLRWVGRRTFVLTAAVLITAATLLAYQVFRQPCDFEDAAPARLALFHSSAGTEPTDEYTPTTADNDELAPHDPPYWLATSPNDPPSAEPTTTALPPGPAPMHFTITAPRAEDLILNLRDFPAWHVSLNNAPDQTRADRPDGLIAIPIPAGHSDVEINYAHTIDETSGDAVTLVALAILVLTCRRNILYRRRGVQFHGASSP